MRKGHLIWVLSVMLFSGIAQHASAQWEMIGPDGSPDEIFKIDSLLYGITKYGFYQSSDDGRTWKRLEKGLAKRYRHNLLDVSYDGVDLIVPAATFSEAGVDRGFYLFNKEAEAWQYLDSTHDKLYTESTARISADAFLSIIPNPFLSNTEGFDTVASLYLTPDKGATWIKRPAPDSLVIADFQYIDNRIFIAAYKQGLPHATAIFYSDDYGATWNKTSDLPGQGRFKFYGPFSGYMIGKFSSNPFYYRSIDRGTSWFELVQGIKGGPISAITIDTFDLLLYSSATMLVGSDSGRQWKPFTTASGEFIYRIHRNTTGDGYTALISKSQNGVLMLCHLDKALRIVSTETSGFITTDQWLLHATDSLLVALGTSLLDVETTAVDSVLISTDRGNSWSTRTVTAPGLGLHFNPWKQGDTYLFGLGVPDTGQYSFLRSSDQGVHWEDISPEQPIKDIPEIMAVTNDTLLVRYSINGQHQYRMSTDAGTTWRVVQSLSPLGINGACFHNGYLYETHGPQNDEFYRSANGVVWEELDLPGQFSTIEFPGIMFSLDGALFISARSYSSSLGNVFHLFRSTNEGITWTDVNEQIGLWGWDVHMVHKGSMMYLVSMGDHFGGPPGGHPKLYSSSDRGVTWKPVDNYIPEADVLFATSSDLFASSWEGGIYRLSNPTKKVRKPAQASETISIFPNPATTSVSVSQPISEPGHYTYSIVDMTGNIIFTRSKFIGETGEAVFDLPVAEFPSGIYCVRILGPQAAAQELFTIVR